MDMRGELQLLRDPVRLANEGMLLVKKKGSAIFFSEDKGKFIVSLQELPFNEHWITPGGHELVRVAKRQVTFIVVGEDGEPVRELMISITDLTCAGLLFLPEGLLAIIFSKFTTEDLLRNRLVNRAFRSLSDPRLPGPVLERLKERVKLEVAGNGVTREKAVQKRSFSHLASLVFASVVKDFNEGNTSQKDYLTALPLELFLSIIQFLGAKDLAAFSATSYSIWKGIEQNEERLWKDLFRRRWRGDKNRLLPVAKLSATYSWKLLWLLNESLLRIRCVDSGALRDHQAKIFKALEATEAPEGGKSWFRVASSLNRIGNRKFGEQFAKLRVALPTFPKARHCVVNVLVVGPPNIGKSSLVMLGCFGKFISNHDVDLDVYGAQAITSLNVEKAMVAARMFTLSRLPDYNDLFNIGAIVVCFDMASGRRGLLESKKWIEQARQQGQENVVIALAGLRADLVQSDFSAEGEEAEQGKGKEKEHEKQIEESEEVLEEGVEKEKEKEAGVPLDGVKETEEEKQAKRRRLLAIRDFATRQGVSLSYEIAARGQSGQLDVKTLLYHALANCMRFPELWFPPINFLGNVQGH